MSSEMRELIAKWRHIGDAKHEKARGPFVSESDKIANLAEGDLCHQFANELDALLARTEAGADREDTHEYTLSGVLSYGAIAIKPEQGAVPSHLRNLLRQALGYLKIELEGRHAAPVANGAAMLVRDVCEMPQADPDAPDTVCIRVSDLTRIAELYTSTGQTSDARDGE